MNKILTIAEGRPLNDPIIRDMKRVGEGMGWQVKLLRSIDNRKIEDNNLDDEFSEYVWMRNLANSAPSEIARVGVWLRSRPDIKVMNLNPVGGRPFTSDKFFQHGLFMNSGLLRTHTLPMRYVKKSEDVEELLRNAKLGVVMKPRYGSGGRGAILVRNERDLDKLDVNWFDFVAEPYVKTNSDWRVFVIGGRAVGAMRKDVSGMADEDFQAKSAGRTKNKEDRPEILRVLYGLAEEMARVSGLDYTGCDVIQDSETGDFWILETNFAAGWQNGFPEVTGVNVPKLVFEWFER